VATPRVAEDWEVLLVIGGADGYAQHPRFRGFACRGDAAHFGQCQWAGPGGRDISEVRIRRLPLGPWQPVPPASTCGGKRIPSPRTASGARTMQEPSDPLLPRYRTEVPADPSQVRTARRWTEATLGRWGLPEVAEDAVLLVSELVTNAVRAAERWTAPLPSIGLELEWDGSRLRIEVTDRFTDSRPSRDDATPTGAESGRGLQVVAGLADRWGWYGRDGGKTVWCETTPLLAPRVSARATATA
jgi:anti-sigma regulatory factor (Ser/Thr protein kinase)